jgi:hypothetical protein
VTLLWLVVIGAEVEADQRRETLGEVPGDKDQPACRRQRLFTLGLAEWLAAQLSGRPLLHGKLAPEPWPEVWHDVQPLTEQAFCSQELYP